MSMKGRWLAFVCALPFLGLTAAVQAQLRCDCESIVGVCSAEVDVRGTRVEITTNHIGCARVDYLIDGQPFVSLVVDGEARENWSAPTASPRISIDSCRVCAEAADGASAGPQVLAPLATFTPDTPSPLRPLIQVQPAYPAAAAEAGVQGWVELAISVAESGVVEQAEVLRAEPPGAFEAAAREAVMRWRYPPIDEARTIAERIEFRIPSAAPAGFAPEPTAAERAGSNPRNACVREGARFNYGDRVEVTLVNACAEPLAVFGCAIGTGQFQGRWTCAGSEATETALAPHADSGPDAPWRAQLTESAARFSTGFASTYLLSRAPNSEYWWVACALDDAECIDAAQAWLQLLAGQPATADPQSRSRVTLARSF